MLCQQMSVGFGCHSIMSRFEVLELDAVLQLLHAVSLLVVIPTKLVTPIYMYTYWFACIILL